MNDAKTEKPYWYPELADADYFARLREDYPEDTAGMSDEEMADHFEVRGKYADTWDHAGDAYNDYEPLADDWFELRRALRDVDSFVSLAIRMVGGGSPPDTVVDTLRGVIRGARAALHTEEVEGG